MVLKNEKVLISGGGIAGCTLAYFLYKYGFNPVVLDDSPEFKRRGYMLALNAQIGQKVAEKMGILEQLKQFEVPITNNVMYDIWGKPLIKFSLDHKTLNERVGLMLNRADLHTTLYNSIKNDVEFQMGQEITAINSAENGLEVTLNNKKKETYDLVIGADGIHSKTRELTFGKGFNRHMGYAYFAFMTSNRDIAKQLGEKDLKIVRGDGFVIAYLRLKNDEVGAYVFHKEKRLEHVSTSERRDYMLKKYGKYDRILQSILQGMKPNEYIFHDGFIQIVMPTWYKNRVCLIGDAAFCPTPASGVGASMAMAASYIVAKNLSENEDYDKAFLKYENYMKPYINKAQSSASQMLLLAAGGSIISYEFTNFLLRLIPGDLLGRLHSHAIDMPLP